jgi:hypothetical protein
VSTYSTAPVQAAPSRPGTLKAAIVLAIVTGVAAIANGAMMLAGGAKLAKDLVVQGVADLTGVSVDEAKAVGGALLESELKRIESAVQAKGYLVIVAGVALVLFGLLMNKAATWARVLVIICSVLTLGSSTIIVLDVTTSLMSALGWAAFLGSIITIVMTSLSANGRYAKALKRG